MTPEGHGNFIADTNRYQLPAPPSWFLKALWDQDAGLVILPSRTRPVYVLARKRELSLRAPLMVKAHNDLLRRTRGSDGDMLASHNVQFVDVIKGTVNGTWSPAIIQDLRERDTWAAGGAAKYSNKLTEQEATVRDKKRADWLDSIDQRAKDSWRSYQARTGQRNHHARNSGLRSKSSSSSTAGLAQGWKVSTPVPCGLSAGEAQ